MTTFREPVDGAVMSRHAGSVGDKPAKYWDYRECRWVTCPAPAEAVAVPAQAQPAEAAEADDPTVVGTAQ